MRFSCVKLAIFVVAVVHSSLSFAQPTSSQASIQIGFVAPLSGGRASMGKDAQNGANLALAELKESGRAHANDFTLVFEDHQGDPAKAVAAFNKLVLAGSRFIVTQNSNASIAASGVANSNKVIQFGISTTSDRYSSPNDYTFRVNGSTLDEAKVSSRFIAQLQSQSPGKIGILAMQDEYPATLRDHLLAEFKALGLEVALNEDFLPQESDFRSLIAKLKAKRAEYVYCLGYQTQCGIFVKQQKEMSLKPKAIIGNTPLNGPEFFEVAGAAAEGVFVSYPQTDVLGTVAKKYQSVYGTSLTLFAANGYDAVMLAYQAFSKCEFKTDVECLRKALYSIKDYQGASGHKSMDDINGDMQDVYTILEAKDGAFAPLK